MRLLRLAAALLCATSQAEAQRPSQPVIANDAIRVELSETDGHVVALRDWNGRQLAGAPLDSVGLWALDLAPGSSPLTIDASAARHFEFRKNGAQSIELSWSDFANPQAQHLRVVATAQVRPDTTTAWRIRVEGIHGIAVDRIRFPRLTHLAATGENQELAVPSWMGQRARDPAKLLAGPNGKGRRLEFVYPGALSLQTISLASAFHGGLYFAADDTAAYRKSFGLWADADGSVGYDMVHLLPNPGTLDTFAPSYSAIIGAIPGDWFSGVERYRKWGTAQYWARQSRLHTGITPEWLRETGIWVWNRGHSDVVLEPAAALMKDAKLPVSVFWHWWHNGPYDTSFPDYLPPREGTAHFIDAVKTAHAEGLHTIVYMNQRLWCVNTPSWKREGAERWAVHERDGSVRLETYNVFDPKPCATMDIAAPFWRNKYAGMADTVIKQYGVDGIYMDQAVLSLVDWSKDHGHDVGGGNYWMNGFRELAKDLRRRKGNLPVGFAGEGGGESWMPDLDAFLTLQVSQERYADPASGWEVIPMFQAAYHPYAVTYGTYGSLTLPPYDELWPVEKRPPTAMELLDPKYIGQFYLEQARMFVWGMQPTIANFRANQLTERRPQIDYLERLAKLRYGMREFFLNGTYLRAPSVDVPSRDILLSRISIYAARLGGPVEAHTTSPEVLSGAWKARNGHVAIALASISSDPVTATVKLPRRAYGFGASARIVRHDETGFHQLGVLGNSARELAVTFAPLQGVVIELIP
jgi:hypothetical protein